MLATAQEAMNAEVEEERKAAQREIAQVRSKCMGEVDAATARCKEREKEVARLEARVATAEESISSLSVQLAQSTQVRHALRSCAPLGWASVACHLLPPWTLPLRGRTRSSPLSPQSEREALDQARMAEGALEELAHARDEATRRLCDEQAQVASLQRTIRENGEVVRLEADVSRLEAALSEARAAVERERRRLESATELARRAEAAESELAATRAARAKAESERSVMESRLHRADQALALTSPERTRRPRSISSKQVRRRGRHSGSRGAGAVPNPSAFLRLCILTFPLCGCMRAHPPSVHLYARSPSLCATACAPTCPFVPCAACVRVQADLLNDLVSDERLEADKMKLLAAQRQHAEGEAKKRAAAMRLMQVGGGEAARGAAGSMGAGAAALQLRASALRRKEGGGKGRGKAARAADSGAARAADSGVAVGGAEYGTAQPTVGERSTEAPVGSPVHDGHGAGGASAFLEPEADPPGPSARDSPFAGQQAAAGTHGAGRARAAAVGPDARGGFDDAAISGAISDELREESDAAALAMAREEVEHMTAALAAVEAEADQVPSSHNAKRARSLDLLRRPETSLPTSLPRLLSRAASRLRVGALCSTDLACRPT